MLGAIATATAQPRTDGPFNTLEWADGVTTSRSGYTVWISLASTRHRVQIPGQRREVGSPEHAAALHISCVAKGGRLPEKFPAQEARGGIYLENHPEHPGAYTVFHPMHWVLGLSGREKERWPVTVRIGDADTLASHLVRARTDYSAPHPGLDIAVPGSAILEAILGAGPIEVKVNGENIRLNATFTASANARLAAAMMLNACEKTPVQGAPK